MRSLADLSRAGRVTLAGSPDDSSIFDAVFKAWFADDPLPQIVESPDEEKAPPARPRGEQRVAARYPGWRRRRQGRVRRPRSSTVAVSAARARPIAAMLGRIKRNLDLLPAIESRTHLPSPRGRRIDVARTAREARRTAGETLRLFRKARPDKPRRLLLLVDVSGSMKAHSEATLRFAQLSDARPAQGRDVLLRHAAVARHEHAEAPPAGRGAGPALRPGLRFRRRHADRRIAGNLPVGLALRGAGARRGHAGLFRRARTRRTRCHDPRRRRAWRGSAIA